MVSRRNIYVGIDVHLKTWHVTTLTESGYKYSFAQHADAKELLTMARGRVPAIFSQECAHELNTITRDFFSEINGLVEKNDEEESRGYKSYNLPALQ